MTGSDDFSASPEEAQISDINSKHLQADLESKEQFKRHRDALFDKAIKASEVMFIIAFPALIIAPYTIKEPAYIVLL